MSNKPIKIALFGASGKMGREIQELCESPTLRHFKVVAVFSKSTENFETIKFADVAIDFSSPTALANNIALCIKHAKPFVVGTTGFSQNQLDLLSVSAKKIPILWSANMSLGANVLANAAKMMATLLGKEFSIDIIESHHIHKKDAPSGTALAIGKAIGSPNINYHSVRAGNIIGEHQVLFSGQDEQINITHRATNRSIFAVGALKVAQWLIAQDASRLYTFDDFLSNY